jgi:hypothetical protein
LHTVLPQHYRAVIPLSPFINYSKPPVIVVYVARITGKRYRSTASWQRGVSCWKKKAYKPYGVGAKARQMAELAGGRRDPTAKLRKDT